MSTVVLDSQGIVAFPSGDAHVSRQGDPGDQLELDDAGQLSWSPSKSVTDALQSAVGELLSVHSCALQQTLAATLPDPAHGVNGAHTSISLAAGRAGIARVLSFSLAYVTATETVTTLVTATFNDSTTATWTDTKAATGTNTPTAAQLAGLHADGKYIVDLMFEVRSTIDSSTATVTPTAITGIQAP